ncbi:MAG: hypothetical protein WBQ25_07615, partial [Nitrososphaeraceae archaeon]
KHYTINNKTEVMRYFIANNWHHDDLNFLPPHSISVSFIFLLRLSSDFHLNISNHFIALTNLLEKDQTSIFYLIFCIPLIYFMLKLLPSFTTFIASLIAYSPTFYGT